MAVFFLKTSSKGHARSISLPARSHPTTLKIEEELNKLHGILEVFSSSSDPLKVNKLCMAIHGLAELYISMRNLLNLPQTQQALIKHHESFFVNELLEDFLSFLDVCGSIRENVSFLKESLGKLRVTLRRRYNEGDNANDFIFFLKNLKREVGKSLACLKHIDHKLASVISPMFNDNDLHFVAVVRALRETCLMSCVVLRAILGWLSLHSDLQPINRNSKWSLVLLKLVNNKKSLSHGGNASNELEELELALNNLTAAGKKDREGSSNIQLTCDKMSALETKTEELEKELEGLFRQLIQARVSLLNILSDN